MNSQAQVYYTKFDKEKSYVFSYFPCLTDKYGLEKPGTVADFVRSTEQEIQNIQRIGWLQLPDVKKKVPVIYINEAKAVFDHLLDWCSRDLSWFKFVWEIDQKGFYGLCILPDMERFLQVSGYKVENNVLQWIWTFNCKHPNFTAKFNLGDAGKQSVAFADNKTEQIVGRVLFPCARYALLPNNSYFKRVARAQLQLRLR